jgi:CHAT domain-containing protein
VLAGFDTWRAGGLPPPGADDGLLSAQDVTGLDLLATDLAVVSAAERGEGLPAAEALLALRGAFVVAGAGTLLLRLWDGDGPELIEEFYRRVLAGEPRAEALRQAQLAVRSRRPHPVHWAGFVCQGDPGPLPAAGEQQEGLAKEGLTLSPAPSPPRGTP